MKKIILGIVVLAIVGGGAYWYFVLNQSNPSSLPSLPNIPALLSSERSLQGFWAFKETYIADPATGEFKLQPAGGEANSYVEFKGNMFCTGGQLDPERKPYPCAKYQLFSVSGDNITLEDPSQPMTVGWKIVSGNLELTLELPAGEGGKTQKVKFVFTKL